MKTVRNPNAQENSVKPRCLSDQTLLAFSGQTKDPLVGSWAAFSPASQKRIEITFDDATRGILVTGMTGTGKTVNVVEPALKALIDAGCSGVILTTKDADLGLLEDFPERIVVVGGSNISRPVNLIGEMSLQTLKAFLDGLRLQLSTNNPYWGSRGVVYAQFIVETQRLMGLNPTLATIHDVLVNPREFTKQFDEWIPHQISIPGEYRVLLDAILRDPFSLLSVGESRHLSSEMKDSLDTAKQYGWHTMTFLPLIQPFAGDQRLRARLCDSQSPGLDMEDLIYNQQQVVLTDIPEHVFGPAGRVVNELLRVAMRNAVLGHEQHASQGYGRDRYTFLVIDEFQHHVNLDSGAAAQGLFDDNSWFDRSREYGHINIVAVQGISSLAAKVPRTEPPAVLRSLLQNVGTTVGFTTHDQDTLEHLERHVLGAEQEKIAEIVTGHLILGQAVVVSHNLARHKGSVAAHIGCGAIHGAPHMAYGLGRKERNLPVGRFLGSRGEVVNNPLCKDDGLPKAWNQWFTEQQSQLEFSVFKALRGIPSYSNSHTDSKGRTLKFDATLDDAGDIQIILERRFKEVGWQLKIAVTALAALVQLAEAENSEHPDDFDLDTEESLQALTAGWRIELLINRTWDNWYCLKHETGGHLYLLPDDWMWISQVSSYLDPLIKRVRVAEKNNAESEVVIV